MNCCMFFCLDTKEPKSQHGTYYGVGTSETLRLCVACVCVSSFFSVIIVVMTLIYYSKSLIVHQKKFLVRLK